MKTIEFDSEPSFDSQYWMSRCKRYKIVFVPGLRQPYRTFRKAKGFAKSYIWMSGHDTKAAAMDACLAHANRRRVRV